MPELEERQTKIEGVLEQIDKRVGRLESDITRLEDKVEVGFAKLDAKLDTKIDSVRNEVHVNFRWLVGIMITMWVTMILTIIFKG